MGFRHLSAQQVPSASVGEATPSGQQREEGKEDRLMRVRTMGMTVGLVG